MDREQAAQTHLTAVMECSGLDGGVRTLYVADGSCRISVGRAASADLVIVQSRGDVCQNQDRHPEPYAGSLDGKDPGAGIAQSGNLREGVPDHEP